MKPQQNTPNIDDLDCLWPRVELLKKIGFSKRIEGRLINPYFALIERPEHPFFFGQYV